MQQNIPRRLMRFYRGGGNQQTLEQNTNYDQNNYNQKNTIEEDPFSPTGRPLLGEIPSMSYEDLEKNKKNYEELKHIEQKNMEEKLALDEVERFKKTHNRMPTKEESEKIAETLYTQLKNTDVNALYANVKENQSQIPGSMEGLPNDYGHETNRRSRRTLRADAKKQGQIPTTDANLGKEPSIPQQTSQSVGAEIADVKSLLEDESDEKGKKRKAEDEFDLGLGDDVSSTPEGGEIGGEEEIENIELSDKEICPNCKKETEKVIYCSKCGAAFCKICAKKEGNNTICPKCGTKTKA